MTQAELEDCGDGKDQGGQAEEAETASGDGTPDSRTATRSRPVVCSAAARANPPQAGN
jgi:hypothetical protein